MKDRSNEEKIESYNTLLDELYSAEFDIRLIYLKNSGVWNVDYFPRGPGTGGAACHSNLAKAIRLAKGAQKMGISPLEKEK